MSAYWISTYLEIRDPDKLAAYAELAGPALTAAGGRFLARGLPAVVHESGRPERSVLIEFPSVAHAVAAHDGAEYQAALAALEDGAVRDLRIVPGVDSRSIFQIGAAGAVGRRLATQLTAAGHRVTGMHRATGQDDTIRQAGAIPVTGDLVADSVEALAQLMTGHDAVVFSAGAHGTGAEQTTAIDGEGLKKAARAAAVAGVQRFVLVSVFMDAGRGGERSEGFEHYMAIKRQADDFLAATDLDWLIVRPGTLLDDAGTGRVAAGPAIAYGDVSRDDVAGFIATALWAPHLSRTIVELTAGDVPINDAVAALAR